MKNKILSFLTAATVAILTITAAAYPESGADLTGQDRFKSFEEASRWMTDYYKNPDPSGIIPAIKTILNEEAILNHALQDGSTMHYFAAILQSDKEKTEELKTILRRTSGAQNKFIGKIIQDAENFKSPYPNDAKDLDFLWAEFLATGKEEPIKKIIQTLTYVPQEIDLSSGFWKEKNVTSPEMALALLQDAAEWSLASNAKQHKKVYEIINNEIEATTDNALKEKLGYVLRQSEKFKEVEDMKNNPQ